MQMDIEQIRHKKQMIRCEKVYGLISKLLLITHIPYIVAAVFITLIALLTQANEMIFYFIEAVIKGAVLVLSLYGITEKETKPLAAAVLLILCDAFLMTLVVNNISYMYDLIRLFVIMDYPLSAVIVAAAGLNYIFGKLYHELEQCEGFPYFNGLADKMLRRADEQKKHDDERKKYEYSSRAYDRAENGAGDTSGSMVEITSDTDRDTTANGDPAADAVNGAMFEVTAETERDLTANGDSVSAGKMDEI